MGRSESALGRMEVEARSVNSRFLDLHLRIPQELAMLEGLVRQEFQARFSRGKISVAIRFQSAPGMGTGRRVNTVLLDQLATIIQERRAREVNFETLLLIPGVLEPEDADGRGEELDRQMRTAMSKCMEELEKSRLREGAAIRDALKVIAERMKERLGRLQTLKPQIIERLRDKVRRRINDLLESVPGNIPMEPGRMETEIALLADKADITEEIDRLGAHLASLTKTLGSRDNSRAPGKALEFLQQEILRETNTIASKSRELDVIQEVLEMKSDGESLKEQLANLE